MQVIKTGKHPLIVATPEVIDKIVDHGDFYPIVIYIYSNENQKISSDQNPNLNNLHTVV